MSKIARLASPSNPSVLCVKQFAQFAPDCVGPMFHAWLVHAASSGDPTAAFDVANKLVRLGFRQDIVDAILAWPTPFGWTVFATCLALAIAKDDVALTTSLWDQLPLAIHKWWMPVEDRWRDETDETSSEQLIVRPCVWQELHNTKPKGLAAFRAAVCSLFAPRRDFKNAMGCMTCIRMLPQNLENTSVHASRYTVHRTEFARIQFLEYNGVLDRIYVDLRNGRYTPQLLKDPHKCWNHLTQDEYESGYHSIPLHAV